jgi:cytochrome subunit of sulfide dehydrogenase
MHAMNTPTPSILNPLGAPLARPGTCTALLVAAAAGAIATAASGEPEPPAGRLLASQCFQCHGTDGQAVGGFESITGESAKSMYESLLEMSRRRPENIMDLQARGFTPEQLRLIAGYLSTLPKQRPPLIAEAR